MRECAIGEQVPHVIGLSGHSLLPFLEAVYQRQDRITHKMVRQEHVAACLADGYYRASGRPLRVYPHLGPGLANGLNGIATAARRTPGPTGAWPRRSRRRRESRP